MNCNGQKQENGNRIMLRSLLTTGRNVAITVRHVSAVSVAAADSKLPGSRKACNDR